MPLRRIFHSKIPVLAAVLMLPALLSASSITGVVTNRTTGRPASGDVVTLIKLAQGMQEAGSTKTDARGRFTLDVADDGVHLVRVTHDKANYFQPVEPGAQSVDVAVFTAAAKVDGLTSEAEVLHMETDPGGHSLSVVVNFFLKNLSQPPKTQFSDRPFDFYLPAGAVIEGSDAVGPGKMAMRVKSPPVPLGDPDHYAMIFPLRPCPSRQAADDDKDCGETRFQISYKVPYTGSISFAPRVTMPTGALVVMVPKSMAFKPSTGAAYSAVNEALSSQAFVAQNVVPSQGLEFTVSGTGQMPRDTQAAGGAQDAAPSTAAGSSDTLTPAEASARQRADTKPGVGLNNPLDSQGELEPFSRYKWWILGALGLALAAGAGILVRPASGVRAAQAETLPEVVAGAESKPSAGPGGVLAALKEELFALESDRIAGRLTDAEYSEQKAALEVVLRRALARAADDGVDRPRA